MSKTFIEDTIVALATPPGIGAISVIRVSGHDAIRIVDEVFRGRHSLKDSESHRIHYGFIIDEKKTTIDDALVSVFKKPNTYTGEDSVEISIHGNPLIAKKIIEILNLKNIRLAEPGEFTKRAFLNDRIDLAQAEAVADVISSRTEVSLRGSRNQLDGLLSQKVNELREMLVNVLSMVELELDFAEEDVEFLNKEELKRRIDSIIFEIEKLISTYSFGRVIRDGVNIAIVGQPNVGKSSLLNYILKESRAIVSSIPGTTRDVIREEVSIDGILFRIFDTAGIRLAENEIEEEGVLRSRNAVKNSDLVFFVGDVDQGFSKDIQSELGELSEPGSILNVLNKIDLDSNNNIIADVKVSAKTGRGIENLLKQMKTKALGTSSYSEKTTLVSNVRHYNSLKKAKENLKTAKKSTEDNLSGEFISVDLRQAENNLAEIIGIISTDDILNNIFSKFCIGK